VVPLLGKVQHEKKPLCAGCCSSCCTIS
jgi:hypothetical protein